MTIWRGWKGNKGCAFSRQDESIDHLFFRCPATRLIRSLMNLFFHLNSTRNNVTGCFSRWIRFFSKSDKQLVLVRVSAMFWTIWRKCNDIIFEKKMISNPMTLIKLMCSWIIDSSVLQIKELGQRVLKLGAKLIERVASENYRASHGWRRGVLQLDGSSWKMNLGF